MNFNQNLFFPPLLPHAGITSRSHGVSFHWSKYQDALCFPCSFSVLFRSRGKKLTIPLDDMKFLDWEDRALIKIASNARHGLPSQLFPMHFSQRGSATDSVFVLTQFQLWYCFRHPLGDEITPCEGYSVIVLCLFQRDPVVSGPRVRRQEGIRAARRREEKPNLSLSCSAILWNSCWV